MNRIDKVSDPALCKQLGTNLLNKTAETSLGNQHCWLQKHVPLSAPSNTAGGTVMHSKFYRFKAASEKE